MRRFGIVVGGLIVGAALGVLVGACSYFECATIDRPLVPGTYTLSSPADYTFVLGDDGKAVETYTDSQGAVRVEYDVAPAVILPEPK